MSLNKVVIRLCLDKVVIRLCLDQVAIRQCLSQPPVFLNHEDRQELQYYKHLSLQLNLFILYILRIELLTILILVLIRQHSPAHCIL